MPEIGDENTDMVKVHKALACSIRALQESVLSLVASKCSQSPSRFAI